MCWGGKCATLHTANQCKKKGHFCPNNREAKTDTDAYSEGRLKNTRQLGGHLREEHSHVNAVVGEADTAV